MYGMAFKTRDEDGNTRAMEQYRSHWLVNEEIQEPRVFRRCAAEGGHGRRLVRIVIGAAIARQEFDAVSIEDSMKSLRLTPDRLG